MQGRLTNEQKFALKKVRRGDLMFYLGDLWYCEGKDDDGYIYSNTQGTNIKLKKRVVADIKLNEKWVLTRMSKSAENIISSCKCNQ